MKIKNKNWKKYKIKKFIFFKSKLEQEIKIRKNPEKSRKIRKSKKSFQKILPKKSKKSFIFERFSLTHSGGSSVSLGILLNKSRSQALYSQCLTARPRG